MKRDLEKWRLWLPGISLGVLVLLCGSLAALQYKWLGDVSVAERERLRVSLRSSLEALAAEFNQELNTAAAALRPESGEDGEVTPRDYAARFVAWRSAGGRDQLFRRVALAIPQADSLRLLVLDTAKGEFAESAWPAAWAPVRDRLLRHRTGEGRGPGGPGGMLGEFEIPLIDVPRFARGDGEGRRRMREAEWLLLEADLDYLRSNVFPGLIERRLGNEYDVKVISRSGARIYGNAAERAGGEPDGSVGIFDVRGEPFGWRGRGGRREPPGANPGAGRWKLIARHRAGSLDLLVDQARLRNLGVASAILLLMLGTGAALIQSMRRMQQLASLQMEFVAGVSHELRTPLTVIRTAAYNLKGKVAANPAHVERYGALIQKESERLTTLVEDVLRFSSARGGQVIREREPVSLESVIEEGVDASRAALAESGCEVEKKIEPGLPLIMGDASALRHALQNLLGNAAKYGTDGGNWIGVSAMATTLTTGVAAVEVRVADRGPGIPAEEQERIFEPFFRGARAVADQIHGTGLGLNLVRKIVEAHKGSISVVSEPGKGAEFVMVIPAAPPEYQDEFSHSAG